MKPNPNHMLITGLLLGLFIWSGAGFAQDEAEEADVGQAQVPAPAAAAGEEAVMTLSRIQDLITANREYSSRLMHASSEDSLVLRIQRAGVQDRFMASLFELAEIIPRLAGEQQQELKARAETVYEDVTPRIFELIVDLRREIDGLRAQRTTIAAADLPALEDRIVLLTTRLDDIFGFGRDHLRKMGALGLDATEEQAEYTKLLEGRADELAGRIELGILRKGVVEKRLRETPGDADTTQRLIATRKSLDANTVSQSATLDIMDGLDLPTEAYRAQLVTATQDLASGLLDHRVTVTLMNRAWQGLLNWLSKNGPTFLVKFLLFLAILFAGRLVARLVRRGVEASLERAKVDFSQLLKRMIVNSAYNAMLALALMIALAQLGISLGPLLAGFGVVGFILGFAMQDSLSNLAAGMMILINRPYDVGDLVEISGVFGKVEHMSMVSTSVLTLDNQKLVVPNSRIWGDVIKNVTDQRVRRIDLVFGISYSDDIPKTEGVLNAILADHPKVLADPEPVVRLHTLNDSSVDFVVRPWVKTEDYWEVHWDVTRAVKMRFDEEAISIPFPQRDVHLYRQADDQDPDG